MKTATKSTIILVTFFIIANTQSLKAQGPNFIALVGNIIGMTSGDIVIKGKNHSGVEWSFTVNISYDSKPILPAKQCLRGFSEISNGVTVAGLQKERNTAVCKLMMSEKDIALAMTRIRVVSTFQKLQLPAFYPNHGVIKITQPVVSVPLACL